jgi:hypothetical protein
MFTSIIKFFQKKKKSTEELFEFPETLILEDIVNEEVKEVKEVNKQKETKDTKSSLTFGV